MPLFPFLSAFRPSFFLARKTGPVLLSIWAAAALSAQINAPSITTTSPLPAATAGATYSQAFTATGGVTPYQWAAGSGVPVGLTLGASSGILSGTPTTAGAYSFPVQVTDASGNHTTGTFSLTVNPAPLQILTVSPLFNGQVGIAYSEPFSASGGVQPYTWTVASGNTGGLTLNSSTGVLSGIPQATGTFTFVVKVADSANASTSQNYSLTVTQPTLLITGSNPPSGQAGVNYDQVLSVAASGGKPPYTWALTNSAPPGLKFLPATIELQGNPTTPGTYSLNLQATDSAGVSASRTFSLTIAPASLSITNAAQLANAALNTSYVQSMTATGGTPPYTWSANGLPAGLSINANTGIVSGTPTAAGSFTPVITVTDSVLATYRGLFNLSVNLPTTPSLSISGLPATTTAAQQLPVQVSLGSAYSAASIQGTLILSFQPASGPNDSTIQFSTGGRSVNFTIAAGSTAATFTGANGASVSQLQVQTGTAAGSIVVSVSNLTAAGVNITPTPAPSSTTQISGAAPVITNVTVIRNADSASGCQQGQICIEITGYTTDREMTQAVFNFSATSGQTLQSSAGSISVDVSSLFGSWFTTSTMGSQFILVQPFTVTGTPADVVCSSVALSNRIGSANATVNQ